MLARYSALKRSDRLRVVGWLVLACGVAGAGLIYWIRVRTADPLLDDQTALGYSRSLQHGVGVMMGPFGAILTDWEQMLTSPVGQALMIAIGGALVAGYFFRVAWVLDEEENDLERPGDLRKSK